MIPFFDFAIGLRMLDSGQNMLDFILCQECRKFTLRFIFFIFLVGEKLRAVICNNLFNPSNLTIFIKHSFYKVDASFASCCRMFSSRENKSGTIVEDHTDFFAIETASVPVKMNRSKAVFSFVPDPGFPALLLFLILVSQVVFKKNLMNGIMGYMPAESMIYYAFQASCATILLFVDASIASKLSRMLIREILRIRSLSASSRYVLGRPNFFGANGSLFFTHCPQTRLTVRILNFISIAMVLELMLLVFDRII
jgi:hypothetical protein